MAIIRNKIIKNKQTFKTTINTEVLEQIKQYCAYAGIYDLGYFIEEAAHYVFKKDLEWRQYQKSKIAISEWVQYPNRKTDK